MNNFSLIAAIYFSATTLAIAQPYCPELVSGVGLSTKHARAAPIYSDKASGWMFTSDQLKDRYDMKSTSAKLVANIVDEFQNRGVTLAILIAPPRPVIAGAEFLNAAMEPDYYDLAAAETSFGKLISGLNTAGALAPNLQELALSNPAIGANFYFKRDTHWTTTGALASAIELARLYHLRAPETYLVDPNLALSDVDASGEIEERGSLADIARAACDTDLPLETAPAYVLTSDLGAGLLGDTSKLPRIALAGSSFSDRYKRDHYRVADAVARAFAAEVDNFSVSGGGAIGAIEAYVLSGALDRKEHELVIWELPYTESFNSTSALRQLLGALQFPSTSVASKPLLLTMNSSQKLPSQASGSLTGIEVLTSNEKKLKVKLKLHFDDKTKSTITISRRGNIAPEMGSASIYLSLSHFGNRQLGSVELMSDSSSDNRRTIIFY